MLLILISFVSYLFLLPKATENVFLLLHKKDSREKIKILKRFARQSHQIHHQVSTNKTDCGG